MKQSSKKISTGTAALYCRLSRDDNMDSESNSIQNQELLCRGWFLPPNTYGCGSFVVNGTAGFPGLLALSSIKDSKEKVMAFSIEPRLVILAGP